MKKLVTASSAALIAASLTIPTANAATVGTLEGLGGQPGSLFSALGPMCDPPNVCDAIEYPNVIGGEPAGVQNLGTWIASVPGEKIIVGYSLGAGVATLYLNSNPPPGADVSFLLIGNPYTATIPTNSYPVTNVVREYDPVADFPDNPFNLLAVLNSLMSSTHNQYTATDLTDPNATVWTEGNVTQILIPAARLPLISWMGAGYEQWDAVLRPIVDSAYNRPVPVNPAPVAPAATLNSELAVAPSTPQEATRAAATTVAVEASVPESLPALHKPPVPDQPVKKPKVRGSVKAEAGRVGGNDAGQGTKPSPGATHPSAPRDRDTAKVERKAERQAAKAERQAEKPRKHDG